MAPMRIPRPPRVSTLSLGPIRVMPESATPRAVSSGCRPDPAGRSPAAPALRPPAADCAPPAPRLGEGGIAGEKAKRCGGEEAEVEAGHQRAAPDCAWRDCVWNVSQRPSSDCQDGGERSQADEKRNPLHPLPEALAEAEDDAVPVSDPFSWISTTVWLVWTHGRSAAAGTRREGRLATVI